MHTPGMYVAAILLSSGQHSVHLCDHSPNVNYFYPIYQYGECAMQCAVKKEVVEILKTSPSQVCCIQYVLLTVHHILSVMISHRLRYYMYCMV